MWTLAPRHRVIVDNDWAGDPDGLVGLAHHVLSPSDRVVAVTSSFLNPMFGDSTGTAERGARLARELLALMDHDVPVTAGCDTAFSGEPRVNEAARAIVDAVSGIDDDDEVVLVCCGPLTNIADALLLRPEIGARITLLWVGGAASVTDFEYNLDTDAAAAAAVFARPDLRIVQFPVEVYRSLAVSVAELEYDLTSSGSVGAWLWAAFENLPLPDHVAVDPVWPLGDSAPLAYTALPHAAATYQVDSARPLHSSCTGLDPRLVYGDLLARLRLAQRNR